MPHATNPLDGIRTYFEDSGGNAPAVLFYTGFADLLEVAKASRLARRRRIDLAAWRAETGRFTLKLADQNVWEAYFGFADLGRSTPFSADGVGALVLLGPGRHTVVAGLAVDVDGDGIADFTSETSYEITVTLGRHG
jgi:hypothetical protein